MASDRPLGPREKEQLQAAARTLQSLGIPLHLDTFTVMARGIRVQMSFGEFRMLLDKASETQTREVDA